MLTADSQVRPAEKSSDLDVGLWLQRFYEKTEPLPAEFLCEREDVQPQQRQGS